MTAPASALQSTPLDVIAASSGVLSAVEDAIDAVVTPLSGAGFGALGGGLILLVWLYLLMLTLLLGAEIVRDLTCPVREGDRDLRRIPT